MHVAPLGDHTESRRPFAAPRRMIHQRQRGLHAGETFDHRRCRSVVDGSARRDDAGDDANHEAVEHGAQRAGIDCGVKLENIRGEVGLNGWFDGQAFRSRGELALDSVTHKDIQMVQVLGPFFHPQQPEAANNLGVKSPAVIRELYYQVIFFPSH